MKILDLLSESRMRNNVPSFIEQLIPQILAAAQKTYDEWDENEDEYAGGGICHLIADEISGVFNERGIPATTVSAEVGEQHVWCVVAHRTEEDSIVIYEVDIHPNIYEAGAGYNWKKIPNVTFDRNDLTIQPVCHGSQCLTDYEFDENDFD